MSPGTKGISRTVAAPGRFFKKASGWLGRRPPSPTAGPSRRRPGRLPPGGTLAALALLLVGLAALPLPGWAQAPDQPWRTLSGEHVRVTHSPGMEELARRAAQRGDAAWTRLAELFLEPPEGPVEILLTDHTDISNGLAQVTPDTRITIHAAPPVDDPDLGYHDEWLELVITHEMVHIFHLDRTGALGGLLRAVFGRVPGRWPFFPGFDTPRWTIEGIATWYESRLTESGRAHGTFHRTMLRTAVLEGRFEELDQASGESPVWPSGTRAYVYGGLFFDHLMERHGEEKMAAFAEAVAGQWIPYRLDAAGRDAFGASLSDEWSDWTDSLEARWAGWEAEIERLGPVARPQRLTPGSRIGLHPRMGPDGRLAWFQADGRSDPQIRVGAPDATGSRELVHTNGVASFDWLPGGDLVMSQLEARGPYRVHADLYRVDGTTGDARRLTRDARLSYPSAFPDGREVVAVQQTGGSTELVRVSVADGTVRPLTAPDPLVHWTQPAVSPDGRWVAAARSLPRAFLDVVVLDAGSGEVVARVTEDRAMDLAPAWSPDGRWLLWSSDRTGGAFTLLAAPMDPAAGRPDGELRLAANVLTAASHPSVTGPDLPGGPWIYLSGYHVDGWEVERLPFRPDSWPPAPAVDGSFDLPADTAAPPAAPPVSGESEPYSALPHLLPRHWEPLYEEAVRSRPLVRDGAVVVPGRDLLGPSVGAETSGTDLVGRHRWNAFLRIHTRGGGRVDGSASWSWAGLGNPVLSAGVGQFWGERGARVASRGGPGPLDTLFVLERERSASLSATLRRARYRSDLALTLGAGLVQEDVQLLDRALERTGDYRLAERAATLTDLRATVRWSTARSYGFQMGGADGASLYLQGRTRVDLDPGAFEGQPGMDRSLDDVIGQARLFRALGGPGHASHVVALRASGGWARGPGAGAGHFTAGGATGQPEDVTGLTLFGGVPLFFPVRGYDRVARFGRYAWSASAEYRFPLALVHQGLGAWPLHLDRIIGSVFLDGGNAWGPELGRPGYQNPRRDALASVGAETTAEVLTLWSESLRVRTGVALPLVGGDGVRAYLRLGISF